MFGLPILTATWWAAKLSGGKRWFNASTVTAIAVALVVVALVGGAGLAWHSIRAAAIAETEARKDAEIAAAKAAADKARADANLRAQLAAEAARAEAADDLNALADQATSLERELARLRATEGNPIIYPRSLVQELRK